MLEPDGVLPSDPVAVTVPETLRMPLEVTDVVAQFDPLADTEPVCDTVTDAQLPTDGEAVVERHDVLECVGEFVTESEIEKVEESQNETVGDDMGDSESNAAVGLFDVDCETLLLVVKVGTKDVVAIPLAETEYVEVTLDVEDTVSQILGVDAALAVESAIVDEGDSDIVRDESAVPVEKIERLEVLEADEDKVPETDGDRVSSVDTDEDALTDGLSDVDSEFEELAD